MHEDRGAMCQLSRVGAVLHTLDPEPVFTSSLGCFARFFPAGNSVTTNAAPSQETFDSLRSRRVEDGADELATKTGDGHLCQPLRGCAGTRFVVGQVAECGYSTGGLPGPGRSSDWLRPERLSSAPEYHPRSLQ